MTRFAALALTALTVVLMTTPSPAAESEPPKGAVPLSAVELLQLYGGKTWKWGEGGGYFEMDGRKFRARTFGDNGETSAAGTWKITDAGKLCFSAVWGVSATGAPAETCFLHVTDAGDIYQRRLPDGGWYVFKHAKTDPADEYNKLVRKDLVSSAGTAN